LIDSATQERNWAVVLDLARELQGLPEATFNDRLVYLSALSATADPGIQDYLAKLQTEAKDDADKVFRLIAWMNSHGEMARSLAWKESLSAEILGEVHVRVALADAYVARNDWPELQRLVEGNTWGGFEFVRFALKARIARAKNDEAGFTKNWTEAVRLAGDKIPSLKLLERTAAGWGWKEEATNLLWLRAETREGAAEALETLSRQYDQDRDTHGLYRVIAHLLKISPNDPKTRNNFAQLALLLGVEVQTARATARELYNQNPNDPVFVSTYAFALEQAGDSKQALRIMSGLTPEQLHVPNTAAYYGIILAAANKPQEAAEYLQLAERARLLPEEEALVARAKKAIAMP
jgi:Flp pilus assembly protein TadD